MDLDGDGHIDLLSGSWPGELFFFKGGPKRTFAAPIKLKDKLGKTINIGGGIQRNTNDELLIAGDAQFEDTGKGHVIIYDGQRIEVPPGKQAGITGTASAVFAVDWDGDGDVDLLVGDIRGKVSLVPNEGTPKAYAFGKEQTLVSNVPHGDAGPFVADWDSDGKLDLLVGAGDGSVWFYRNVGDAKAPKLAAGVQLVPPGFAGYGDETPKDVRRGVRAKICAADWNGDGRLDLLVGDFTTQKPTLPEPTPAQKAEHDKLRKELEVVQKRWGELIQLVHGPKRVKTAEEQEKVRKEIGEVSKRMNDLRGKLPVEYENHGWVWLFLRQPAIAKADQP